MCVLEEDVGIQNELWNVFPKGVKRLDVLLFFFFFQAEDGIRDKLVTGVQTCALPISLVLSCRPPRVVARAHPTRPGERRVQLPSRAHGRGYAGLRVEVRELLDGRLVVRHDGRVLATQPSPGPDFILTPRGSPSTERQGRRQRQATEMRKALTELARAEKQRPAGLTTDLAPAAARAEPPGGAPTHDRQGGCSVDTPARARNSPRAQWRPAPSHPWRRAVTSAVAAKKRQKPIPPGG